MSLLQRINKHLSDILDFQSRVWVVNIYEGEGKGGSFVLNEDNFSQPLQWMKHKGYNVPMLLEIDNMKRSQVIEFDIKMAKHRILRIK